MFFLFRFTHLCYTEYKRSITVRHNTAIFVIHCYMFWLKEITQELHYKHLKERKLLNHYALFVSQILQILTKIHRVFVALQNKGFLPYKTYLSQQWTLDGCVFVYLP